MKEEFLHYIWQLQLFQPLDLQTSQGEKVTIVHPGTLNTNAGAGYDADEVKAQPVAYEKLDGCCKKK